MDINGHTHLCEDYVSFETTKQIIGEEKEKVYQEEILYTAYEKIRGLS